MMAKTKQRKSAFNGYSEPGMPAKLAIKFEKQMLGGKTITDLTMCATSKLYLVSISRYRKHCELNPAWGRKIDRLSKANVCTKKQRTNGKRLKTKTICLNGLHPMKGHNLMIVRHRDGSRRDERRCLACANKATTGRPMTEEARARIFAAFERGDRPRQFIHGLPFEGGPRDHSLVITSIAKFTHQRKIDPELARVCEKYIPANCSVGQALRYAKDLPPEAKPALIAFARLRQKVKTARKDLGLPPSKRLRS